MGWIASAWASSVATQEAAARANNGSFSISKRLLPVPWEGRFLAGEGWSVVVPLPPERQ